MKKKIKFFTLLSISFLLMTALIFIGGSCNVSKEDQISNSTSEIEENEAFESAEEIVLTKTAFKEIYPQIEMTLEEVFGGAKLTGFLESMESIEGGETVKYTLKRKTTIRDLNLLLGAFSKKGYETEFSVQEEGVASFGIYDTLFNFIVSYEIDDQEITILVDQAQESGSE